MKHIHLQIIVIILLLTSIVLLRNGDEHLQRRSPIRKQVRRPVRKQVIIPVRKQVRRPVINQNTIIDPLFLNQTSGDNSNLLPLTPNFSTFMQT